MIICPRMFCHIRPFLQSITFLQSFHIRSLLAKFHVLNVILYFCPFYQGSCSDRNQFCPSWRQFCTDSRYRTFMETNCQKTCNLCSTGKRKLRNLLWPRLLGWLLQKVFMRFFSFWTMSNSRLVINFGVRWFLQIFQKEKMVPEISAKIACV